MKTINIYLTREEKLKADKVRQKYKVSLSTIAEKICYQTLKAILDNNQNDNLLILLNTYISNKGNYKTSIKPRLEKTYMDQAIEQPSKFISNSLKIYLNKEINKYVNDEKIINKYYSNIDNELSKADDPFYNYNNQIRNLRRAIRQNPKYWEKAINETK